MLQGNDATEKWQISESSRFDFSRNQNPQNEEAPKNKEAVGSCRGPKLTR